MNITYRFVKPSTEFCLRKNVNITLVVKNKSRFVIIGSYCSDHQRNWHKSKIRESKNCMAVWNMMEKNRKCEMIKFIFLLFMLFLLYKYTRGPILPKVFFPKNFGHIGKFGNIGHPFCTGIYREFFYPKNFGHIGKFGNIEPEILAPPVLNSIFVKP